MTTNSKRIILLVFSPSDDDGDLGFQYSNWGMKRYLNDNFVSFDEIMNESIRNFVTLYFFEIVYLSIYFIIYFWPIYVIDC